MKDKDIIELSDIEIKLDKNIINIIYRSFDKYLGIKVNSDKENYYKNIIKEIFSEISNKRATHTLSVIREALKLGEIFMVDKNKLTLAALLHDYTKEFSYEKNLSLIKHYNMDIPESIVKDKEILHGFISSELSKIKFNISDNDILNSIKYHTTGRPYMSKLEKIIFLSDLIEANRNFKGLKLIKEEVYINKDLDKSILLAYNNTIQFLIDKNKTINNLTIDARNQLVKKIYEYN